MYFVLELKLLPTIRGLLLVKCVCVCVRVFVFFVSRAKHVVFLTGAAFS